MIAAERQRLIIRELHAKKVISVQELAQKCSTTEMTIRRDLDCLEKQNLLKRSHGGAVLNDQVGMESMFGTRQNESGEIKELLGREAAKLVKPGDCIAIDVGTTTYQIARFIKEIPDIKVITASIPVVTELSDAKQVKVVCTGGELSVKDMSLTGHNAIRTIEEYILDKVFIGVAGISFEYGYTLFNMQDALVKRALMKRAKEVIVVAHSQKIGLARHARICGIEEANMIITDSDISPDDYENFQSRGVEVVTVSREKPEGAE